MDWGAGLLEGGATASPFSTSLSKFKPSFGPLSLALSFPLNIESQCSSAPERTRPPTCVSHVLAEHRSGAMDRRKCQIWMVFYTAECCA